MADAGTRELQSKSGTPGASGGDTDGRAPGGYPGPSGGKRHHSRERRQHSREREQHSKGKRHNSGERWPNSQDGGCIKRKNSYDRNSSNPNYNSQQRPHSRERGQHDTDRGSSYPNYDHYGYQGNRDQPNYWRGKRGKGYNQTQDLNVHYDDRAHDEYQRGRDSQNFKRGGRDVRYGEGNRRQQTWQQDTFQGQGQEYYNSSNANQYQGRRYWDEDETVFISKTLSYILRHGAEKQGFQLLKGGFLYVDEILKRTKKLHGVTEEEIKKIVETNDKQRFALEKDEEGRLMIRANQGHTIEVEDLALEEITSPDQFTHVIHGTYNSSWEIIKKSGLSRMNRNHIHFAPGEPGDGGVISGMRKSCDVLIYIDIEKALKDGLKFYRSANNVILCPGDEKGMLYPCYFSGVQNRHPRHLLEFDNTITKDTVKHEPKAGKYANKKKEKSGQVPVGGTPEEDSPSKNKSKKNKNKDKKVDEEHMEEESNHVPEMKAAGKPKDASENWDSEADGTGLGAMFGEAGDQDGCRITSGEDNKDDVCDSNEKIDDDNDTKKVCDRQPSETDREESENDSGKKNAEYESRNPEPMSPGSSELDEADKKVSECHISQAGINQSSASQDIGAASSVGASSELIEISDIEASVSAVETLLDKKPEAMAVCCYGDDLGTEKGTIRMLLLVTDELAYVYQPKDGDHNLIKEGRIKDLFENQEIQKVFYNVEPQSLSLVHEYDIILDGTPVWDLNILYEKCFASLPKSSQDLITDCNLDPHSWDDESIVTKLGGGELTGGMKESLIKRGEEMLKLFCQFDMVEIKKYKKNIFDAVSPPGGFMFDKINMLRRLRNEEKGRREKERRKNEKTDQQNQQQQSRKKQKKNKKK